MTIPRIGFIGLGLMGTPIALKLLENGFPLTVWGRTEAKLRSSREAGASVAASPAELAAASDIVMLCVSDTAAVEDVMLRADGIAAGAASGMVIVDHSSIRPDATRALAERLRRDAAIDWIDAPVSGGMPGVAAKTLAVMCGGEETVFERVRPVIMSYAGRCTLMGPAGAGQTTKLINQMLCGVGFAVVAEATSLALKAGIDAARIPQAIAGGRADSRVLQEYMPRMAERDFEPTGRIDIMVKDLDTVAAVAAALDAVVPVTELACDIHRRLVERGLGAEDPAALVTHYD